MKTYVPIDGSKIKIEANVFTREYSVYYYILIIAVAEWFATFVRSF